MRHFALKDSPNPRRPALLFETDIDFHDVRSGIQVTDHAFYGAVWLEDAEGLSWTSDMVCRIRANSLTAFEPPWEPDWPERADHQILDYLLNHYRVEAWRNSALGNYSQGVETRAEFEERCRELLREKRFRELTQLREVFVHRFFELEKRANRQADSEDSNEGLLAQVRGQIMAVFSSIREDLSRWFVDDSHQMIQPSSLKWSLPSFPDIDDRLSELKQDLITACNRISQRYEEEAQAVEPYTVGLTASAVQIVSRNILWE